ncbi:hypothetical protein ACIBQ1_56470 [Nonomuraea sp. NPDC050153]|uniref:hypothetical protein n=1 Tax=Nonomuraea sp. NPDC050153 TaxID=3364359 RepID=UPI00379F5784
MARQWKRTAVLVAVALSACGLQLPVLGVAGAAPVTAQPVTQRDNGGSAALAARAARVSGPGRASDSGRVPPGEPHLADLTLELSEEGRAVTVGVTPLGAIPDASVRVQAYRDGRADTLGTLSLGRLAAGQSVRRSVRLPSVPEGDSAILVRLHAGSRQADPGFLAVRRGPYGVVAARSFEALPEAELRRGRDLGRLPEQEFRTRQLALHAVPGADPSAVTVTPFTGERLRTAAADVTISGRITYRDLSNTQRPVRNALLKVIRTDGTVEYELGRTSDAGNFSGTISGFTAGSHLLKIVADNAVGLVHPGDLTPYYVASGPYTWTPGNSYANVNYDIATRTTDTGRAFALLDALRTVGNHYQGIRRSGWKTRLAVAYPGAKSQSGLGLIEMRGSSVICEPGPTYCNEDAFDWTVLAHEAGHVVASEGGFAASPGGPHGVCDGAWDSSRSKQDSLGLAFSEGWATFYGQRALLEEGVPAGIPNYDPTRYFDGPFTPPNASTDRFFYDIETASAATGPGSLTCAPEGEDSEMEVQRVLWDLYDSAADADSGEKAQWGTTTDVISTMVSARPSSLSAAYQALSTGRSWAERKEGQKILAAHVIGPKITVTGSSPPTIDWGYAAGGRPGGSSTHRNNDFEVQFVESATGALIRAVPVGSAQSYTPAANVWSQITEGRGNVTVQVAGRQTSPPATGPYLSPTATVALSAQPHTALNSFWQRSADRTGYAAMCGNWSGGDGTQSVVLPSGRRAWFFSDTYLGDTALRPTFDKSMLRNSIVVQEGTDLSTATLRTVTGGNTCRERDTSIPLADRYAWSPVRTNSTGADIGGEYHWSGTGKVVGGNVVYFYLKGSGLAFKNTSIAVMPVSTLETSSTLHATPTDLPAYHYGGFDTPLVWGSSIVDDPDGYTYVYGWGVVDKYHNKQPFLARVPPADLADFDAWRFYKGGGAWSSSGGGTGQQEARPLGTAFTDPMFSVVTLNGHHWLVTLDPATHEVVAYPSTTRYAFTTRRVSLYTVPEAIQKSPDFKLVYDLHLQDRLSADASAVVISYNVNTTGVTLGCRGVNDYEPQIYRARFVTIPAVTFDESAATTPAVTRAATPASAVLGADGRAGRGIIMPPLSAARAAATVEPRLAEDRSYYNSWAYHRQVDKDNKHEGCPYIPAPTGFTGTVLPGVWGWTELNWDHVGLDVGYKIYEYNVTENQRRHWPWDWNFGPPRTIAPLDTFPADRGDLYEWYLVPTNIWQQPEMTESAKLQRRMPS